VAQLAQRRGGKTLIFLPSFEILETTAAGLDLLREDMGMSQEEVDRLISEFHGSGKPLAAVFNGRLSEGIDLSASTVLLIGIPFSPPTTRMAKLLKRLARSSATRTGPGYTA